jgi:fermentation-respiration switch protein FrsA (DUF1100 family)
VERTEGEGGLQKSFLTLRSTSGLEVDCGELSPQGNGRAHPAVILLAGNASGAHAVDDALGVEDVVTLSVGYRYTPPSGAGLVDYALDVPKARRALLEVVPAVLLARDYLKTRKDVDPSRIALVGLSFGALYVPVVVAQDRGFAAAVMVDGGGGLASLLGHNLERAGVGRVSGCAGLLGARLLRPLEPLHYAQRISPVPLVMINATGDALVPRENALAFFSQAREPKSLVWLETGHVHVGDRALLRRVAETVRRALEELRVLEARPPGSPRRS